MYRILQLIFFISLTSLSCAKLNGQKVLGINFKANPKELTGYDLDYFVGLENFLLGRMGSQLKFLPMGFSKGHLSNKTVNYLENFGLTEVKISYPLGISKVPSYRQYSYFTEMRPNWIHLHTKKEAGTTLITLYKTYYLLKRQLITELGSPEFEQSDESQNFLRWLGLDYQVIVNLDKTKGQESIWLSYFPK